MRPADAELSFESLLEHAPFLRRLARALVQGEEEARDLVQDTWLAALRRPPGDGERARGWLARIARNRARDAMRTAAHRAERERDAARPEAEPPPSELEERVELARRVLAAVQSLREPYRATLWLRYYEDLVPKEIARRQGVSIETVTTRLRRGKAELRERLGERERWLPGLAALAGLRGPEAAVLGGGVGLLAMVGGLALAVGVALAIAGWWNVRRTPSPVTVLDVGGEGNVDPPEQVAALPEAPGPTRALIGPDETSHRAALVAPAEVGPCVLSGTVRWAVHERSPGGASWMQARVGVVRVVDGQPEREPVESTSATGGDFELDVPGGGDVLFVAVAEGLPVITRAFSLPPNGRTVVEVLELGLGYELAGRVIDEDGEPLAGAALQVRRADASFFGAMLSMTTHGSISFSQRGQAREDEPPTSIAGATLLFRDGAFVRASADATTDDEGRFRIGGLAPGAYRADLAPARPGAPAMAPVLYLRAESAPPALYAPSADALVVWRERRLALQVLDGERPLDGVSVGVGREADVREHARDPEADWPVTIGLDAVGRLEVAFFAADDPALHFSRAGRHPVLLRLADCSPDAEGNVIVRLPRAGSTATLRLQLEAGAALLPAQVEVVMSPARRRGKSPLPSTLRRVLVPVNGEALLEDVPPGVYQLKLELPGGTRFLPVEREVEVGDGRNELELALELGGVLELELARSVHPDEGLRFHAEGAAGDERPLSLLPSSPRAGELARLTPTLPAGDWALRAARRGRTIWRAPVRLVAGEVTRVPVALPPPE